MGQSQLIQDIDVRWFS